MKKNNDIFEIDTIEGVEEERARILYETAINKYSFIKEIKQGLGDKLKMNPNKVKVIKKTKLESFKIILKKIFTKF